MYAYAANNPVKYTDPDGRVIDTSALDPSDFLLYERAVAILGSTQRGKELLNRLDSSPMIFKISTNTNGDNYYSPNKKTINWDPSKVLYTSDDSIIKSEVLLAHEMGHAEQNLNNELPPQVTASQKLDIEHKNLINTEIPIAKELGQGQRKNYDDWKYYENINGVILNPMFDCPYSSSTIKSIFQNRRFEITQSLLRTNGFLNIFK